MVAVAQPNPTALAPPKPRPRPELKRRIDYDQPDNKLRTNLFVAKLRGSYDVHFKPVRPPRSKSLVGYYFAVVVPLYFELLASEDEELSNEDQAHDYFAAEFLTVTTRSKVNGEVRRRVRSTTDLDEKEFSDFFEKCVAKLSHNGVEVPPPTDDPQERAAFRRRIQEVKARLYQRRASPVPAASPP